ncbi:hypothetical protein LINPERHAP2_LOCUS336 [Linum perenne]
MTKAAFSVEEWCPQHLLSTFRIRWLMGSSGVSEVIYPFDKQMNKFPQLWELLNMSRE